MAFRDEIIETAKCRQKLGLTGACSYPMPSSKEIFCHQKRYRRFTEAQELKIALESLINTATDRWVPPKDFEPAQLAEREMLNGTLEGVLNNEDPDEDAPIKTENDLEELWPFDSGEQELRTP